MHTLRYKLNRVRYYFKILVWAKTHSENVKDYKFLLGLRDKCHENYLEAERKKSDEKMLKAKIQEELLTKILNHVRV